MMVFDLSSLLEFKKNVFSQNGEDGVIEKIFQEIGTVNNICCEFGAWDGIHLSNTRNLILKGWTGILIESDPTKFKELVDNYENNKNVYCINRHIDNKNNLDSILMDSNIFDLAKEMDFLSIDIDGLDFDVFKSLKITPRIICVEINAGHSPETLNLIEDKIANKNIGQPFGAFVNLANSKGYSLLCYTGNAFFIRKDIKEKLKFQDLSNREVYKNFINHLNVSEKEWLYLVNLGLVTPFHQFKNSLLSAENLDIMSTRLFLKSYYLKIRNIILNRGIAQ